MPTRSALDWILFMLLALIWGSSFILMKVAAEALSGWQIGAVRILSAGILFAPLALLHLRSVPLRRLPLILLSGLLGNLFPAFLFALAIERRMSTALAGILNSLTPLFVVLIGIAFFRLRVAGRQLAGVLIGLAGLIALNLTRGPLSLEDLGFTGLVLLATVCYGLNVNLVGRYLGGIDPLKLTSLSLTLIAVPAAVVVWMTEVPSILRYDPGALGPLAAAALLGVVGSAVATGLFYLLIRRAGGLFASLVTYGIPVVAIGWGLWAGESVSLLQLACLGVILCGVFLANRKTSTGDRRPT